MIAILIKEHPTIIAVAIVFMSTVAVLQLGHLAHSNDIHNNHNVEFLPAYARQVQCKLCSSS